MPGIFKAVFPTVIGLGLALALPALADEGVADKAMGAANQFRRANEVKIINDFKDLLRLPNHGSNHGDMRKNAAHIMGMMEKRGIATRLLEIEGAPPAILGRLDTKGAETTLMIYIHYDGQVTDASRWAGQPFEPILRKGRLEDGAREVTAAELEGPIDPDWRLYGRSTSDDKAPIIAVMAALDALRAAGIPLSVNLKFFLEGEEEMGSPHLEEMVVKYKDHLAADFWLFFDGPQDQRGNPRVVLGVRGVTGFQLTVYGPYTGLHSGHYGNFAPNPIARLAHLLASMRDETGKVLIEGFYDDVEALDAAVMELIRAIPDADAQIMKSIQVAGRESPGQRYEETILWPALNYQGIRSGGVGREGRNIIEPSATASIGLRLVPNQTIPELRRVIEAHIKAQGYHIVHEEPDEASRLKYPKIARIDWGSGGYEAVRIGPDDPHARRLIDIMQEITGGRTLVYPILGGSLPLAHITRTLDVPLVVLPIANQDNNQHAPNENIRLGHLWRGIEIYAGIFAAFGAE